MVMLYWLRYLRHLCYRDPVVRILEEPFCVFRRDSFFGYPIKYIRELNAPLKQEHGIERMSFDSEIKVGGKEVEVHLDAQNCTPVQIEVKTVGTEIIIEGKKEIRREDGWTRSQFERHFQLPKGFHLERMQCHLDKGKLNLVVFGSKPLAEKNIPIQRKSDSDESS